MGSNPYSNSRNVFVGIGAIGDWRVKIADFAQEVPAGAAGDKKPDSAEKKEKTNSLDELIDGAKSLISKGKDKAASVIFR